MEQKKFKIRKHKNMVKLDKNSSIIVSWIIDGEKLYNEVFIQRKGEPALKLGDEDARKALDLLKRK